MAHFERVIRNKRAAIRDITWRAAADSDDRRAMLQRMVSDEHALIALGFRPVADIVATTEPDSIPINIIMRVLVDAGATTVAHLIVEPETDATLLMLESYTQAEEFVTVRALKFPYLALGPSSHRQDVAPDLPHAQLVARHYAFVPFSDPSREFVRISSAEHLVTELQRNHDMGMRWRDEQSPEVLLDADLRGILGAQYARHGKYWARRLTSSLPRAALRRNT